MTKPALKAAHTHTDVVPHEDDSIMDAAADTGTTAPANDAASDMAKALAALPLITFSLKELGGMELAVPRRRTKGYVLVDDAEALTLDMAEIRQFCNNQNANAKARAERYLAAKTDADREANKPLTQDDIVNIWREYRPHVGGAPRQSSVEKLNLAAAWRAWVTVTTEHNEAVRAGLPPVLPRVGNKIATLMKPPVKTKAVSKEAHAAEVAKFETAKVNFLQTLLAHSDYADRIAKAKEQILAERDGGKNVTETVESVDAMEMASLL